MYGIKLLFVHSLSPSYPFVALLNLRSTRSKRRKVRSGPNSINRLSHVIEVETVGGREGPQVDSGTGESVLYEWHSSFKNDRLIDPYMRDE